MIGRESINQRTLSYFIKKNFKKFVEISIYDCSCCCRNVFGKDVITNKQVDCQTKHVATRDMELKHEYTCKHCQNSLAHGEISIFSCPREIRCNKHIRIVYKLIELKE